MGILDGLKKKRTIELPGARGRSFEISWFDAEQGKRITEVVNEKGMLRMKAIGHRVDLHVREI